MKIRRGIAITRPAISKWEMAERVIPVVLFMTVCVIDPSLFRGVTTARYFYFTAVICIALPLFLYRIFLLQKSPFSLRMADVAVVLFILYCIIHRALLGGTQNMEWWLFLLMIPFYFLVRAFSEDDNRLRILTVSVLIAVWVQILWGFLQLSGLLPSYHNGFRVTGSFFNPGPYAGFVAVSIPLAAGIFFSRASCRWERMLGCAVFLSSVVILPFTGSRAAWIAAISGGLAAIPVSGVLNKWDFAAGFFSRKIPRIVLVLSAVILSLSLLYGVYHLKKDSADGRLFIWMVSTSIIKEHPLFGVGTGRFSAVYGQAQADYFLSGKGTETQVLIADHPDYAFNEYIHIAVELGLAGLSLFLLAVGLCLSPFISRKTCNGKSFAGYYFPALVSLLAFSLFSYPFDLLPLLMLFVTFLAVTASRTIALRRQPRFRLNVAGWVAIMLFTMTVAAQILPRRQSYRDWQEAHLSFRSGGYVDAFDEFRLLHRKLSYEKKFLMEYARCLSHMHNYEESNRIFKEYLGIGCDPEAYNYMGNNLKALGEYAGAEQAYIRASLITPNRHYPEYLLMKLYLDTGRKEEALDKARHLMEKPVKINSPIIRRIREEALRILDINTNEERNIKE